MLQEKEAGMPSDGLRLVHMVYHWLELCVTLFPQGKLRVSSALRSAKVHSHQNCMILITDFLRFIPLLD